jgi:hypothetical protein
MSSPSPLLLAPPLSPTPLIPVITTPAPASIALPENLQFLSKIPWWVYVFILAIVITLLSI